jgi:hypothetical protein
MKEGLTAQERFEARNEQANPFPTRCARGRFNRRAPEVGVGQVPVPMERNLAGKLQTRFWVNRINLFSAFLQVTLYLALTNKERGRNI